MFKFGAASKERLKGVHPDLRKVTERALELSDIDFTIIEGKRSDEQCRINWGLGRTAADCKRVGINTKYAQPNKAKVTWLTNPYNSNHRAKPDGYGHALDIYPYPVSLVLGKKTGWEPLFDKIAKAMFKAAKELGIKIRWGADWDLDNIPRERGETDNPHFELKP